jgi:hypothetical protein
MSQRNATYGYSGSTTYSSANDQKRQLSSREFAWREQVIFEREIALLKQKINILYARDCPYTELAREFVKQIEAVGQLKNAEYSKEKYRRRQHNKLIDVVEKTKDLLTITPLLEDKTINPLFEQSRHAFTRVMHSLDQDAKSKRVGAIMCLLVAAIAIAVTVAASVLLFGVGVVGALAVACIVALPLNLSLAIQTPLMAASLFSSASGHASIANKMHSLDEAVQPQVLKRM